MDSTSGVPEQDGEPEAADADGRGAAKDEDEAGPTGVSKVSRLIDEVLLVVRQGGLRSWGATS